MRSPPVAGAGRSGTHPNLLPERSGSKTRADRDAVSEEGSRRKGCVSRDLRDQCAAGFFEKGDCLIPAYARIVVEKLFDRIAALEKIEKRLHRHARADKDRSSAQNIGVRMDDLRRVHDGRKHNSLRNRKPADIPQQTHVTVFLAPLPAAEIEDA
jgi:hypothetical protein